LTKAGFTQGNENYILKPYNPDDITSWRHFKIEPAKTSDDSLFYFLQVEANPGIEQRDIQESINLYVILTDTTKKERQLVFFGDPNNPQTQSFEFRVFSKRLQDGLLNYTRANKINLAPSKYNYASPILDVFFRKVKVKELIAPVKTPREITANIYYVNPYLSCFGGEPVGIPIKQSFGFSFAQGTPFTGALETDMIGANFHLLGLSVGITTRLKELVRVRNQGHETEDPNSGLMNFNNVFSPKIGMQVSYAIPLFNILTVGYYSVIDTGDWDPPVKVRNQASTDINNYYMPNLVLHGSYFNWEVKYPFRCLSSTRAKIYFARHFYENHIGFSGREMQFSGSVFDMRLDATLAGTRNFQFLFEALVSNIGEMFSLYSFALGPTIRLSKNPSGQFTVTSVLVNARFKLGDYFTER
jgi:hypothetical protein